MCEWPRLNQKNSFAAAAGTAWYSRQQIAATAANSQLWVSSHLEFVGVLWKAEALRERLEELLNMSEHGIQFHWSVSHREVEGLSLTSTGAASTLESIRTTAPLFIYQIRATFL